MIAGHGLSSAAESHVLTAVVGIGADRKLALGLPNHSRVTDARSWLAKACLLGLFRIARS